jgi:ATP-dependent RNA helicase RhlE
VPFHSLGLGPPLTDTLRSLGFERPTPIQEKAIPPILEDRDVVGSAQTGSGKTAAFLLPILTRLMAGTRSGSTRVLILVPTRELATQVHTVAVELSGGTDITCMPVYGGVAMDGQAAALRTGVDIAVATPGRLLDHVGRGSSRFRGLEVLVLDEADRMLDMGFLPDIRRILGRIPSERQTLLFSATMPREIVTLSRDIMNDPVRIRVGAVKTTSSPVGITHAIFPVPVHRKTALLEVLLRRGGMHSVLVFTRTKIGADRLTRELEALKFAVGVLHGDRSQKERERDLAAFMDGYIKILVATDVAARGLDVEGITHVVNYDFPRSPEDYLHRVGRTARAEAKGDAFTLVTPAEEAEIAAVEREMGASIPRVTLPEFDYAARPAPRREGRGPGSGRRGKPVGGGRGRGRRPAGGSTGGSTGGSAGGSARPRRGKGGGGGASGKRRGGRGGGRG